MAGLPKFQHPNLLVGSDTYDDAGVYQINETTAIIQTLDFFTPMVDDPYAFGQIAAANALSDIYAMGGTPITAMNIAAFPTCMDMNLFQQILLGGADKVKEAGALLIGGHTIEDDEPKYGLSVTGLVHPERITPNSGGQPGDLLFLTKQLGTGIIATGIKGGVVSPEVAQKVSAGMATLNKDAAAAMRQVGVRGATDITGFGFLGHLKEIIEASGVGAVVWHDQMPIWPEALELAEMGIIPGGAYRNQGYISPVVQVAAEVPQAVVDCLYDPQTSGGLLMAVPAELGATMEVALEERGVAYAIVGRLQAGSGIVIK